MARFQKTVGTINRIEHARTFIDGEYCRLLEFMKPGGQLERIEKVFFTLKLSSILKPKVKGEFYFWNSHCYAFRGREGLVEDIDGARASYFQRDARLLLIMAASVVMFPVAVVVVAKKVSARRVAGANAGVFDKSK